MKPITIKFSEHARSWLDVELIDGRDDEFDPPSRAVFRLAYDFALGQIAVPADDAGRMALGDAIAELANDADAIAEDKRQPALERTTARHARTSLTSASTKIYRLLRVFS